MSINPKYMDFIESTNLVAREIALAFGVPACRATWYKQ
ncbi:hypothetical protein A1E_04150 [Rickettsia canadensis str. McKiel]|uniref:Uncharacterized protein n=1 Tax=Rickettsia canadensis (strain McKiel) TaxID=293613 RepID=A8EZH2_RICCK|nr:hypothetical protein A1E_04150 [Rickettsia canadensis str. McKiel]